MTAQPRQSFASDPFYYVFGMHRPQIKLDSGSSVFVECPDCDNRLFDGTDLPVSRRQRGAGSKLIEGNPVAGPIEIAGSGPGDSIAVRILSLQIPSGIGRTGIGPGHGLLPAHLVEPDGKVPRHLFEWDLDPAKGRATLRNPLGTLPIEVALKPFVGCIGVCPDQGQQISTLYAGTHGGNMDLPSLVAGATIQLPVFAPGALLMLGDIHAAQGNGEAIGGAIETAGQVHLEITLVKDHPIPAPRIRTSTEIGAVASGGDLRVAIQVAFSRLVNWLSAELRMNPFDAFNLISQSARIEIGNLVLAPFTVATFIPIDGLPRETQSVLEGRL